MTLDPQRQFSEKNHTIVQQIFEGLVRFGPEGQIEPALATEWKRLDERTMQFKLRRGVKFHNGESFDAKSVQFSIKRYLDKTTGFPAYGYIDSLERVDVVDSHTVNLVTRHPDGLLLNRLAGFILLVPPKYYATTPLDELKERPVGSGAFRFERWEKGSRVVLKAYPDYWDYGYPKVGSLVFRFIPHERQVEALLSGSVDILTNVPGTRTLEVQRNPGTAILKGPVLYTIGANFNVGRKPLSDKRVRQAVNLAVNREDLIRYDVFGNGISMATLSLKGEFGHNAALKPYPYDPARSRVLLSAAGYPDGFVLKVLLKVNAERAGRIIARQLERVGIRTDFTVITDAQLFEHLRDKSVWDMAIYSCPDPMVHSFFIPSIFVAGGSPFSLATDPGIDERMGRIVAALEPVVQRRAAEELDHYLYEEYLALPTYQRLGVYGVRRGVKFRPYLSGMPYFFKTSVDGD